MHDSPVTIVTGGTAGIGLATARMLIERGYAVTIAARNANRLEAARTELSSGAANANVLAVRADVSRPDECDHLLAETINRFARVDALVNNAGSADLHSINDNTFPFLEEVFAANAFGPAYLIAACWAPLVTASDRSPTGCVVNVSSMAAFDPFPGLSAYAAAKAATESLTRSIVNECDGRIRAFTVAPGATETALLRHLISKDDLEESATIQPEFIAGVIADCIEGKRDEDIGRPIRLPASEVVK